MIGNFITQQFGKVMIAAIFAGVCVNGYLYQTKKAAMAQISTLEETLALKDRENNDLTNRLENANLQITQYQEQVKALHSRVLDQLQQSENRSNALLTELEKAKNWSHESVPSNVSRLLNKRDTITHQSDKAHSSTLPDGTALPTTKAQDKQ